MKEIKHGIFLVRIVIWRCIDNQFAVGLFEFRVIIMSVENNMRDIPLIIELGLIRGVVERLVRGWREVFVCGF